MRGYEIPLQSMKKTLTLLLAFALFTTMANAQEFDNYHSSASGATTVHYSPDGKYYASGTPNGFVLIRKVDEDGMPGILPGHSKEITDLSYHPNGKYIASASKDFTVKVWNLETEETIFHSHTVGAKSLPDAYFSFADFSRDGRRIYYGGSDGKVYTTDAFIKGGELKVAAVSDKPYTAAHRSPGGKYLALATFRKVQILDTDADKVARELTVCPGSLSDIKYNADGSQLGCLCENGMLYLIDAQTGAISHNLKVTTGRNVVEIAFSPDGKYLVTGDMLKTPKVWDLGTMQSICSLTGHQESVRAVDFAPDSKHILTGDAQQIKRWKWRQTLDNVDIPTPPTTQAPPPKKVMIVPPPDKPRLRPNFKPKLEDMSLTYTKRNIPDSLGDRRVKTGKRVLVNSEQIEIAVWDSEEIDGDTISLFFNGEWLLKEFPLKRKKKTVSIIVKRNADNYLILHAHNEGKRPPNTAALTVYDGRDRKQVGLSSNLKNSDSINFKFRE